MHHIQKSILKKMLSRDTASFSELKPAGVASNAFTYHLNKMLEQKLLKRLRDGRYGLLAGGRSIMDRISVASFSERIQPKIVTLIICTNMHGDYLLYKRRKQPYLGKVGFPYGKIHLGECVADAATREFSEKTGLTATMQYRGDVYTTVYEGDELFTHTLFHVFSATSPRGILVAESSIGECFWSDLSDIKKNEQMPGFQDIVTVTQKKKGLFFEEFVFKL